jgi:hypothetical protein
VVEREKIQMPNAKRQTISKPGKILFDFGCVGLFTVCLAFGVLAFGVS